MDITTFLKKNGKTGDLKTMKTLNKTQEIIAQKVASYKGLPVDPQFNQGSEKTTHVFGCNGKMLIRFLQGNQVEVSVINNRKPKESFRKKVMSKSIMFIELSSILHTGYCATEQEANRRYSEILKNRKRYEA